jgi:very-short-patch-repair endonuclease
MTGDTIPCLECGKQVRMIHANHLRGKACTGLSKEQYVAKHPNTPLTSQRAWEAKSKASLRLMGSGYREVLVARLVEHNRSEAHRKQAAVTTRKLRPLVIKWHQENRGASLAGAAHARIYKRDTAMFAARAVVNKTSKLHLGFKTLMEQTGLTGFTTEGKVGPFEVDEAHYETCLAVEVDGCWWHGCATCGHNGVASTLANDKAKNAYLKAAGWCVLRLPGHIVEKDPQTALEQIKEALDNLQRGHAHD